MERPDTFADPATEAGFRSAGFAVVPLLRGATLDRARTAVSALARTTPDQFAATLYDPDAEHRRLVDATLRPLLAEALAPHLTDHRCYVANLLVKPPGPGTELGVHQDWTFVDEERFTSATVWCPLVDVDEGNGTLVVFAGSHLLGPSFRGSPRLPTPFDGLEDEIRAGHGTVVTAGAGDAVVYDHRLVHWSGPNRSDEDRPAIGAGIAPRSAPLVHLHADADGLVTRYEVEDDFLSELTFASPPPRPRSATPVTIPDRRLTPNDLR